MRLLKHLNKLALLMPLTVSLACKSPTTEQSPASDAEQKVAIEDFKRAAHAEASSDIEPKKPPTQTYLETHQHAGIAALRSFISDHQHDSDRDTLLILSKAIRSLATIKSSQDDNLIKTLSRDSSAHLVVREAAIAALLSRSAAGGTALLTSQLLDEPDLIGRKRLLFDIVAQADPSAIPALEQARTRESNSSLKQTLGEAIKVLSDPTRCFLIQSRTGGAFTDCTYECAGPQSTVFKDLPASSECPTMLPNSFQSRRDGGGIK